MASSVDAKLLKSTKFPPEFSKKVDMQKVNAEVMKKWIAGKISEILGSEDDVVIELCFNLIEGARYPDIKTMQIQLTGFLDKDTAVFCKELWNLCLSAQSNPQGVPKELLEAKKLELIQEKLKRLQKNHVLVETRTNAENERQTTFATGNVAKEATVEREEREDAVGDGEIRGEEGGVIKVATETSIAEEAVGEVLNDGVPLVRNLHDEDIRQSESRSGILLEPPTPTSQVGAEEDVTIVGVRLLPDRYLQHDQTNQDPVHLLEGGSAQIPDPALLAGVPGHLKGVATTVVEGLGFVNRVEIVGAVVDHQVKTHLVLGLQDLLGAEGPHLLQHRHPPLQDLGTLVTIAILAHGHHLAHAQDQEALTSSRSVSPPRRRRSRSRSSSHGRRDKKRRRSVQRYEPANKRRRNTSSDSDRNRKADTDEEKDKVSPPREASTSASAVQSSNEDVQAKDPKRQASELREKLLREKIKKMRILSTDSVDAQANAS
ncbi:uncharacterized protein RCO7_02178 [Rhynchosporium graminicola]|uniref:PWI domain-containing protein n=1 Tax=Rhynchosporium graminicola TaxID=2792576 RepID=A0A1E1LH43_9HELO|nr:uncharacterized protein RCO7_02178 [Rhynchosporium commune]